MSSSDKSRQSSGARSLFSRSKNKDKRYVDPDARSAYDQLDAASMISSHSPRHKRESSTVSIDRPSSPDPGVHTTAGVLTSMPYDTMSRGPHSPVPMDYMPKGDQVPVRREPLPHHLNKSGVDYHQYPTFDQSGLPAQSYIPASRPSLAPSNVTMASTGAGKQAQYQQWGPARGSMLSVNSVIHPTRYDSHLPPNARASSDNASVYSGKWPDYYYPMLLLIRALSSPQRYFTELSPLPFVTTGLASHD